MTPLFDKHSDLVGWMDRDGKNIFDTGMSWVAFISNGHAWSASTGNWLGNVSGFTCRDQSGCPVIWNPQNTISGTARPARPSRVSRPSRPSRASRPSTPSRPSRPSTPSGGWSALHFDAWISQ